MKKLFIPVCALLAIAALCSGALAQSFGPYYCNNYTDNSTLSISRVFLADTNEYEWTFTLHHGAADKTAFHSFSVGLLADDTDASGLGSLTSGHFYGYQSSFASATAIEGPESVSWYGFSLPYNATDGWFKFKTDLAGVGFANDAARDTTYTPDWLNVETPVAVPEPASLMALFTGIAGLVGLKVRRK